MSVSESDACATRRPGRRRDATKDVSILAAARELLAERGYDAVTMDDVAERAGVGKATVYRRWTSKVHLAVDAMLTGAPALTVEDVPDTGSLRDDLMSLPRRIAQAMDDSASDLLGPAREHPEVAAVLHQRLVVDRVAVLRGLLERGQARGEVPAGRDLDVVAVVGPALIFYAKTFGEQPVSVEFMERIIDEVLVPLAMSEVPGTLRG